MLKTGNTEQARRLAAKLKKQGTCARNKGMLQIEAARVMSARSLLVSVVSHCADCQLAS